MKTGVSYFGFDPKERLQDGLSFESPLGGVFFGEEAPGLRFGGRLFVLGRRWGNYFSPLPPVILGTAVKEDRLYEVADNSLVPDFPQYHSVVALQLADNGFPSGVVLTLVPVAEAQGVEPGEIVYLNQKSIEERYATVVVSGRAATYGPQGDPTYARAAANLLLPVSGMASLMPVHPARGLAAGMIIISFEPGAPK